MGVSMPRLQSADYKVCAATAFTSLEGGTTGSQKVPAYGHPEGACTAVYFWEITGPKTSWPYPHKLRIIQNYKVRASRLQILPENNVSLLLQSKSRHRSIAEDFPKPGFGPPGTRRA